MVKIVIDQKNSGQRADKFLKKTLPLAPASFIYKMFRKKDVRVNGKAIAPQTILKDSDVLDLFLYEDRFAQFQKGETKNHRPIQVVYEDDQLLVVNKPAGLLVQKDRPDSDCLCDRVLTYLNDDTFTAGPVHRLDRNTSGLVMFGKTMPALQQLNEMVRSLQGITKKYLTICLGTLNKESGQLGGYMVKEDGQCRLVDRHYPGALSMKSTYKVLKTSGAYSLLEVTLITGRTHQIRLQLSGAGHPLIGDRRYGDFQDNKEMLSRFHLRHQLLHAYYLHFEVDSGPLAYLDQKTIQADPDERFMQIVKELF